MNEVCVNSDTGFTPVYAPCPTYSNQPPAVAIEKAAVSATEQVLRFRKAEIALHWSIAIPFVFCFVTGMTLLLFFNLRSQSLIQDALSWVHRISGACLMLCPILSILKHRRDYRIHRSNIRESFSWTAADVKWLMLMPASSLCRKIALPEQGKFNAAEKLNFIMVLCTYSFFIATGVLLLMPGTPFVSWILHVSLALLAAPLVLGHIYMAVINRSTRVGLSGMISGYVDRHWAKHHYGRWYREHYGNDSDEELAKGGAAECESEELAAIKPATDCTDFTEELRGRSSICLNP
jgi:formate dehydrogenase gamma subunit